MNQWRLGVRDALKNRYVLHCTLKPTRLLCVCVCVCVCVAGADLGGG